MLSEGDVVRAAETETSAVVTTSFPGSNMALEVGYEVTLGFFKMALASFPQIEVASPSSSLIINDQPIRTPVPLPLRNSLNLEAISAWMQRTHR